MATETAPTGASNILAQFLPQKQAKSSEKTVTTEQTDLSPDAINEIIRNMMEGDSGLAALLQRQAGGGLYNSTTSQLLANDLAARVAGKAALASAPRTVKQQTTRQGPSGQVDPKYALGMQLAQALAGKLFGQQPMTGKDGKANSVFDQIFSGVLGKDKKKSDGTDALSGMFSTLGSEGFSPAGSFDFSAPSFGFTGGGAPGSSFGGNFASDFGGFGGFGSGGFDSLSFGLGGNGYSYDPFSLTAGGNYALGNTYGGGAGYDVSGFGNFDYGGGFGGSDYGSFGGGYSAYDYQPADYGFSSSNFW